jgi:hypothetical protein
MKKKLRIAVVITPDGKWTAMGGTWAPENEMHDYADEGMAEGGKRYWIDAEVEVPQDTAEVVPGEVTEA